MSRAWLLPEHLADVLPAQARRTETLRRRMLDQAVGRGFELVIPPLLEHLESLLSGTGRELDLHTFKLVDQLSGRSLGLRADTTPQAARIDAHLLNRSGVTRLCYCGPVLHTRPQSLQGSREALQFGAELFGHAGLEADLEIQELAIDVLADASVDRLTIDMADARILRGVLAGVPLDAMALQEVAKALSTKDASALAVLSERFPEAARQALGELLKLFGGADVLDAAERLLPQRPVITEALRDLRWLATQLSRAFPSLTIGFDLGDMGGYAYYSGARFALYGGRSPDALARGGRYDEVGAVFGRNRPAVGFSVVDLKELALRVPDVPPAGAVRVAWGEDPELRAAVRRLRDAGETVVWALPGDAPTPADGPRCDRELRQVAGRWVLHAL
ncbi:MAG: ATP phosphoribosyltransferase regulatory subunit [Rubrivivax sp.]|jgi:ATP phosphoribosyltransferase regulatory subunit|nr:ATP phosphoribosyltransferase regulatory subunit [Rubrivivax sp.]